MGDWWWTVRGGTDRARRLWLATLQPRSWWRSCIVRRFPALYRYPGWDNLQVTLIRFGFACDNGWARILWDLSRSLDRIRREHGGDLRASQVKETYATLRFYYDAWGFPQDVYDRLDALIDAAEARSAETCEHCGRPGGLCQNAAGTWFRTLCPRCARHQGYHRSRHRNEGKSPAPPPWPSLCDGGPSAPSWPFALTTVRHAAPAFFDVSLEHEGQGFGHGFPA